MCSKPSIVTAITAVFPILLANANAQSFTTSPAGLTSREGGSAFAMLNNTRYQVVDNSVANGKLLSITSIAFRRDGSLSARESAGSVDVTLNIGTGIPLAHLHGDTKQNWKSAPTTAFQKNSVSFPDWSSPPTTPPASFDFELPFKSTYLYGGLLPLAWELTWQNYGTNNGRPLAQQFDNAFRSPYTVDNGTPLGIGCGSFVTSPSFLTAGPASQTVGMQVSITGDQAPSNAPVLWAIDLQPTNIPVPGWCAPVRVFPNLLIPLGTTDSTGAVPVHGFAFPYDKSAENVSVYSQLVSTDGQGIVLARATANKIPSSTTNNEAFASAYIQHPTSISAASIVLYGGSIVARLKH